MNSIRLSRFNAFLYRVNSPYPNDAQNNRIVHLSLIAALNNPKNFEEEDGKSISNLDEQVVLSIAKWACVLLENTASLGFH
jgi:hypothetical protein